LGQDEEFLGKNQISPDLPEFWRACRHDCTVTFRVDDKPIGMKKIHAHRA
jgi:hypothetical protein